MRAAYADVDANILAQSSQFQITTSLRCRRKFENLSQYNRAASMQIMSTLSKSESYRQFCYTYNKPS